MVFPSLAFNVEPGLVTQFSAIAVLAFSFVLHRLKKLVFVTALFLAGIFLINQEAHSLMAVAPGHNNTYNLNRYYGTPWGYNPSLYFYPQLPYHGLWGPQPHYFQPHPYSPYAPQQNCPFCGPRFNPQPQFPGPYHHPGGGVS